MQKALTGMGAFLGGAAILCLLLGAMRSADSLAVYGVAGLLGGLIGLAAGLGGLRSTHDRRRIARLNRIQTALRRITHLVAEVNHCEELVQPVCSYLRQSFGYRHVWVAILDKANQSALMAHDGLQAPLEPLRSGFRNGNLPECVRRALSHPGPILVAAPRIDCRNCPLAAGCAERSVMTTRLAYRDKTFGVLSVGATPEALIDPRERDLFQAVARDIAFGLYQLDLKTLRRRTGEALKRSEARFRNLVENALTGIFILQDNKAVYRNPEQKKAFASLPKLFKLQEMRLVHPEDVEKVRRFQQQIKSRKKWVMDIDFRFYPDKPPSKGGEIKWVFCRVSRIEYLGREAFLFYVMDITRAREMEHLLRIQDKMASLGRVAAGIAHEIRNPLSGINIYLNTLEKIHDRPDCDEKVREIIERLQSASGKIETVIRRVIDFSRPTSPKLVPTQINHPIEEALRLCAATLRSSGIRIERELSPDLPACQGDPQLIEQVILNLITNAAEAIKHQEGLKTIAVSSSVAGHVLQVSVADSGPGVPPGDEERIFTPFFTTKKVSTGIGLSLSRRIIADHGGTLAVGPSPLGGAMFTIQLPLTSGDHGKT
ncbi:MAG: ATP-binding protein [Desulfobacterales bacterium]